MERFNGSSNNGSTDIQANVTTGSSLGSTFNVLTTCLFAVIIVTGLLGNSLVIWTVIRWKDMKTSCNYLLMTIAMADIGVAGLAAPLRIIERYVGWPFGQLICQFLVPLQDVFVCVSVVAHTAIALERYRAIVTPFKRRMSLARMKLVIVGVWTGCYVGSGLPVAPFLRLKESNRSAILCRVMFPSITFRRAYIMFLVIVFIVSPLVIQTWAYSSIVKRIRRKTFISCSNHRAQGRARLIKMLITIVLVFDVCYLPRGILMLLFEYSKPNVHLEYVNLVTLVMYYCKHVVNPVILFTMSTDFRAGFNAAFRCQFDAVAVQESLTNRMSKNLKMATMNTPRGSVQRCHRDGKGSKANSATKSVTALLGNPPESESEEKKSREK